jgi:hypothetical protein
MTVYAGAAFERPHVTTSIIEKAIRTLNVAGNREHEVPGIGETVVHFLGHVLQYLGHQRS